MSREAIDALPFVAGACVIDVEAYRALGGAKVINQNRPRPTTKQILTAAEALTTGAKVSLDVLQAREAICAKCDKVRQDDAGKLWCSVCGCGTSSANKEILNLAAYEERLPRWGCHHPLRGKGKGWPV